MNMYSCKHTEIHRDTHTHTHTHTHIYIYIYIYAHVCVCTRMNDQNKDEIDPKRPPKGTTPNNYRPLTCLPIKWKILTVQIREKIYFLLTSRVKTGTEIMLQRIQRHRRTILYWSAHPQREQDRTQKGIWYGPTKLDDPIYPTPPLGQDMTQGQFFSGV